MTDGLAQLRLLYFSFCSAVMAMAFVVIILVVSVRFGDGESGGAVVGVGLTLVIGIVTLVVERIVHRRPLDGSSPRSLVASFRTRWMVELALAETPVLVGFALFLVVDRPEPFLVGMTITALGFWSIAPTAARLEQVDEELAQQGCPLRVTDALRSLPPGSGSSSPGLGQ